MSSADITIADDPAIITLSVDPEYIQEGQSAKQVILTATRNGTEGDHTINLSVGGGTATDGTDYTIWTFSPAPRIAPGETSTTFTLTFTVNTDNEDEGNETVILSGAASGAIVKDAVVTIGNPESITLSVNPDTIAENGGDTEVTVTATLSEARAADTVVNLTLGGTATDPADYTSTSLASITIPKGETTTDGTLTITPVDDAVAEGEETIAVSGESGARTVSSADITLTDYVAPVISFETAPTSVTEGQTATYVVKLEGSRTTNVTVEIPDRRRPGCRRARLHGGGHHAHLHAHRKHQDSDGQHHCRHRIRANGRLHRHPLQRPGRRRADALDSQGDQDHYHHRQLHRRSGVPRLVHPDCHSHLVG